MATQGIVSIIVNGKMAYKIIAGSDGYNVPELAEAIRASGEVTFTREKLFAMAREAGLGSMGSLVVMDTSGELSECDEPLPPRYRETFENATFNPRWEHGTADHVEVVELKAS